LATLDYAGICLQARRIGGDYFDFLEFGGGRVGLVVGDVSGKGLGAALLMANLQAHVRSQYSLHRDDLTAMLTSVNHLFLKSAPAASYATLFFGVYDDRSRQLRFVNCGHPPALLLRRDGAVQQMATTSPVLGMFETWTGLASSVDLDAGDVMVLYTDGVTEALDAAGDEFGVTRLAEALCVERSGSAERLLDRAVSAVRSFSGTQQDDDITIVVARCTSSLLSAAAVGSRSPPSAVRYVRLDLPAAAAQRPLLRLAKTRPGLISCAAASHAQDPRNPRH
jgi:serine phosphatase RsbU (regulator of sigma subunit)